MAATITITPISAGNESAWSEFVAELQGPRRIEWAQSQRRRGITRQVISLTDQEGPLAVVYSEVRDPEAASIMLMTSEDPFDVWFRTKVDELHDETIPSRVVFDSAPRPGPWRGWRR